MPDPLLIRGASSDDASAIRTIYAPIVTQTTISFEETVPSIEVMADRIETYRQDYPYLVAERDGQTLGFAYGGPHRSRSAYRWSVDVSVYVGDTGRRQGIGRALYQRLLQDLTGRGYHAAFAGIALPNTASIALHEALGFEPVGIYRDVGFKHGQWLDVSWWQRLL